MEGYDVVALYLSDGYRGILVPSLRGSHNEDELNNSWHQGTQVTAIVKNVWLGRKRQPLTDA
eukprot:1158955-Pelagomonas_calceolata.AAC.23